MAAKSTRLRAVKPDERKPVAPQTVIEAADSGDHRALLVAMRTRIAKTITGDCPPRDLASLTRRLQDISKEIEQLDAQEEQEVARSGSVTDEAFDADVI